MSYESLLKLFCFLVLTITLQANFSMGANILFYMGAISTISHRIGLDPLANKLVDRGHNVTFLSPHDPPVPHPKVTNYLPPELKDIALKWGEDYGVDGLKARLQATGEPELNVNNGETFARVGYESCERMLASPDFIQWTKRNNKFDLVVVDRISMAECAYGLAYKMGAKTMSYMAIPLVIPWDHFLFGVPIEHWSITYPGPGEGDAPSLWESLAYLKLYSLWNYGYKYLYLPEMDKLLRRSLDLVDMPPLEELIRKDGVQLINNHHSDCYAKSLPPFVVPVGGMHLTDSKGVLPKELEEFVNKGSKGYIYISFGSAIKFITAPKELVQIFFRVMESLPEYQFLLKWEGSPPPGVPGNALLQAWFPQNDVLAHPKIKGFVTQGGQVSMQETIYHGVPVIVLPVNGDQDYPAIRARIAGNGVHLDLSDLTSEGLKDAILGIQGERFIHIAQKLKTISRDRPMSAVDTAVWWTEYILRHEDTHFLKPSLVPWYRIVSLDIVCFIAVVFTAAALSLLIFSLALVRSIRRICATHTTPNIQKEKAN